MQISRTIAAPSLALALLLAACGGGSDDDATPSTADTSTEEPATGSDAEQEAGGTVEVPSRDGAMTIAEFMSDAGPEDVEDYDELIIAVGVVGTDADGYIAGTDLVVTEDADQDAQFLCIAGDSSTFDTYRLIPVDAAGNAIDCG